MFRRVGAVPVKTSFRNIIELMLERLSSWHICNELSQKNISETHTQLNSNQAPQLRREESYCGPLNLNLNIIKMDSTVL